MDFLEIAKTRQSCRAYDSTRPVEPEKLNACLEAARLAPSACNAQPYHITVAMGELGQQVAAATRGMGMNAFTAQAPVFLVISEAPYNATASAGARFKGQDYRSVDIGIAAAYLTAEAQTQGLSSCILGWFDNKKLQGLLNLTQPVRLVICLGYAKPDDPLRPKKRKDLDQLVTGAPRGQG